MGRLAVAAALAALLALAPAASARVIAAQSVLPPGESGLVTAAGPGPHVTDQVGLLTGFRYKTARMNWSGTTERPHHGVRIVRDGFGVPAVYGRRGRDEWWGVGYATAQDRLAQIEVFRRATSGHLAAVLGPSYLDDDIAARRDFYTDRELRRQLRRLPRNLRARFPAFAAGVNAWIAHLKGSPSEVPLEFSALGVPLPHWTAVDSIRIGDFLLRTVPSDDGSELANLAALRAFGPQRFKSLLPLRVPGSVTTIPRRDGRFPSQPGRTRAQERRAFKRSRRWARSLPAVASASLVPTGLPQTMRYPLGGQGSFMWAIKRPGGGAFLYSGPQLGYNVPQRLYELEVHGPRDDVRGVVPPGVPAVAIGHNRHVAWGFTSAVSDDDDLYAERLRRPGSREYRFKGRWHRMHCRHATFHVKGAATRHMRLCRTVHGPVQQRAGGVAYARRYAAWQHEGDSLVGLEDLTRARNLHDVDHAMDEMTWTENVLAADDHGHIGFWHPGNYPLRPRGWDERLPYPGDGRAEWRGLLPRSKMPKVIDPRHRRWLLNWNNPPSAGFTEGDASDRQQLFGRFHRVAMLGRLVRRAAHGRRTFATTTVDVVRRSALTADQFPQDKPALRRALNGATGPAADVLRTLVAWNGDYGTTAADGTVDPGVAAWRVFKASAQEVELGSPNAAEAGLVGTPGSENYVESTLGEVYGLRKLSAAGYRTAAAKAAAQLTAHFGTADPTRWREPRAHLQAAQLGLAPAPDIPLMNRGSWEQRVELGP